MVDAAAPLVLVLAVAAGLVSATLAASWVHSRQTAFYRRFLANILLFNLLTLLGLLFHLMRGQLPPVMAAYRGAVLVVLLTIMAAFKLAWLLAFAGMNHALLSQERVGEAGKRIGIGGGALVALYGALLAVGVAAEIPRLVAAVAALADVLVIGGAIVLVGALVSAATAISAPVRRRSLMAWGGLHGLLLVAVGASVLVGWLWGRDYAVFNGLMLTAYNLVPLVWILRFQPGGADVLEEEGNPYGLTAREREIVELIGAGLTNQEVADRLFISLATVKDHNHNVFRKTGVRSRLELAILFRPRG